ncbi:MAG: hypothetical protein QXW39_02590 [Candidatus Bathyarchaeia archaeon]
MEIPSISKEFPISNYILFSKGFMKPDVLNHRVDKLLILLALRAKLRGLEPSISDYHKELNRIFNYELCYNALKKRLGRLEEQGFLKSELVKGFARNDLVDSKGEVRLRRSTKVFKKVYTVNDECKALKQFVKMLKNFI